MSTAPTAAEQAITDTCGWYASGARPAHNDRDDCPKCDGRCRYAPAAPCPRHPAFEADYCPGCGTAARIGGTA